MRLRVHTIVGGRYYKAGENVPDEEVSPTIAKYAVTVSEDGDAADMPERRLTARKHPNMRHRRTK